MISCSRRSRGRKLLLAAGFFLFSVFIPFSSALAVGPDAQQQEFTPPKLEIPIPNVSFSKALSNDSAITLPWIGEYVSGVYTFLISIVGLVAAVMMIIGGFQYLTSGGDSSKIASGKKRITDALIGLVLAFGSYILLYTINPNLVQFASLQLTSVDLVEYQNVLASDEEEEVGVEPEPGTSAAPESARGECGASSVKYVDLHDVTGVTGFAQINTVTVDSYKQVAGQVYNLTKGLPGGPYSLTGTGRRPLGEIGDYAKCSPKSAHCGEGSWSQTYKWEGKCLGKPKCGGAPICNPYGWDHVSLDADKNIILDADACPRADNCPHTTGSAVDITCTSPAFAKWFKLNYPKSHIAAEGPFYAPCQRILETVMLNNGWCRLKSESWHFEKPVKSGKGCSYSSSVILGQMKNKNGTYDYKDCNGVYDLEKKTCTSVSF